MATARKKAQAQATKITEYAGQPIKAGDDTHVLSVIPIHRDIIVISISTYGQSKPALDVRRYFESEDGEWKPTSRGIRIPAEKFLDVLGELTEKEKEISRLLSLAPAKKTKPAAEEEEEDESE